MISVSFLFRWKLRRIASNEANGEYGQYIASLKDYNFPTHLSLFAQKLVNDYVNDCRRKEYRFGKLFVKHIYARIENQYARFKEHDNKTKGVNIRIHNEIDSIKDEIRNHKADLDELINIKHSANSHGFKPVKGLNQYAEITLKIREIEHKIENLEETKSKKTVEQETSNKPNTFQSGKLKEPLYRLIPSFKEHINTFNRELNLIFSRYDKIWAYYWYKLCQKCDVNLPSISFDKICIICNHKRLSKENFFEDERNRVEEIITFLELEISKGD